MRVLFVNNYLIGSPNATGTTMQNMFSGIENLEIMQFTPCPNVSQHYTLENVEITSIGNSRSTRLNAIICNHNRQVYTSREADKAPTVSAKKSHPAPVPNKLLTSIKSKLVILNELFPGKIGAESLEQIRNFHPDLIYTLGAHIHILKYVLELSRLLDIPVVVHNMDDIYNTRFAEPGLFNTVARRKMRKLYHAVYARSKMSLAIGEKMMEEYEKTFHLPFEHAMNCVDLYAEEAKESREEQLLIFSGGMYNGRLNTVRALAQKVEELPQVRLEIYAPAQEAEQYQSIFEPFSCTKLLPYVPKSEQMANLARADVLVHVESFAQKDIDYFRLSMSTKIAEYAAVGRPILCIGSPEIATVQFVEKKGIGVVAHDTEELSPSLKKLKDPGFMAACKENMVKTYQMYFCREQVQSRIMNVFRTNLKQE